MTRRVTLSRTCRFLFLQLILLSCFSFLLQAQCGNLYINSIIDGPLTGGTPKGVQLCASGDIADLSIYGIGSANNGGGSDGVEFSGMTGSLSTGSCIWIASEAPNFTAYFGFAPDYTNGAANINGDDAMELFCDPTMDGDFSDAVINDLYGDINVDGNGECWEYLDGYAISNTMMPNNGVFDCANYTISGANVLDGGATVDDIAGGNPFPPNGGGGGPVCSITGVAVGAATCTGDNAEFTVSFTATDGSGAYNVIAASAAYGFAIGDIIMTGVSPIDIMLTGPTAAGSIDINVEDAADAACAGTVVIVTIPECPIPANCPTLAAVGTNPTSCASTDGSIALTTTNVPDGTYDITYADGTFAAITITSGAGTITGLGDGDYNDLVITIPACASAEDVDVSLVSASLSLAAAGTNPTSCGATDGSIALTTTNVPDGTYDIMYAGGTFAAITITSGAGTITGLGDGDYNDLVIAVAACASTEDVDISLASPPSISNIIVTTTCNADGTYCADITFDANNPANADYTANINGVAFGPFTYVVGVAQSATALCDASFIGDSEVGLVATVTDGAGGAGGGNNYGPIFISEIHYDNFGTDEGELIEVTAEAGTDLTGYSLALYNGGGGTVYNTVDLTPAGVVADAGNGCGAVSFDIVGIQNGAPDGIALVDAGGAVIEFISYEGAFMATDGPATGMMSVDVMVVEAGEIGESLQLTDNGWEGPTGFIASPNAVNIGLSCPSAAPVTVCSDNTTFDEPLCPVLVCGISNVSATTTCNPFGGFDFELCFDYENPDGPEVMVVAGGQNMGTFPYPAASGDCIQIQGIQSSPSEWTCSATQGTLEVQVFDTNTTFEGIPFISEFHYDNGGTDENEFIEITAGAGTDLSAYQLELYNGNGGVVYSTIALSGAPTDQGFGCGAVSFAVPGGIQNGPDGFALVEIATGNVLQFISYEGLVEATTGSAAGTFSTDILVSESAGTTATQSLELTDNGWMVAETASEGTLNANITSCLTPVCSATTTVTEPDCCPAPNAECGTCTYYLYLHDALGNGWDGSRLMVSVNEAWPATEYKLTPTDGFGQYYPIDINDGGTIDLMYMNGANTIEHSYQLYDGAGNIVFEDGALVDGLSPTSGVNEVVKAECPECCQEEATFTVAISMGNIPEAMSWEITDGFGERIAYANAGDYAGFTPGTVQTAFVNMEGCNDYRFTAFSALNNGWGGGTWQIISDDPTRGTLIIGGPFDKQYLVAEGPCMFSDESTSLFTLPCHTECPVDETVLADDIANCAATIYTPPTIEPFVCQPNSCHGNTLTTTVEFPTAVGGAVVGPQATTTASLPVGSNPIIYQTTYADGQIIRCTMTVFVIADANPSLTCNDNVIVSLAAADSNINDCAVTVTPDMVLEAPGFCHEQYTVTVFDLEGTSIGNQVGPAQAGQTLTYNVQHIGASENLCWGTLLVEDKYDPTIVCTDYTVACNHPQALNENWTHTDFFQPNGLDMPANIAGGTAAEPSETIVTIAGDCTPLGEIIQDININLNISHNDLEDLEILLAAPNGDVITLMSAGTCNNQGTTDMVMTFDQEATAGIASGCSFNFPGIQGDFRPVDPLSAWYGLPYTDFAGDWQILIYDNDATLNEGIGFGEVNFAQIEIKVGFPTPYAAFDCSLQSVDLLDEAIEETNCDQGEWAGAKIVRIWQAVDAYGNSSTCAQTVNLQAPTYDQIVPPMDVALECGQVPSEPGLDLTGIPFYDCFDLTDDVHGICDVSYTYEDNVLPTCGQGYKIIRTWTILNWCSGNGHTIEQLIKVEDTTGPMINADNVVMDTDAYNCSTNVIFDGVVTDACSNVQQVVIEYTEGGGLYNQSGTLVIVDLTNGGSIDNLPLGVTEVNIRASDSCGNVTNQMIAINVIDTQVPVAICDDQLNVSLGGDGTARVYATDFDEGSYDNCGDITLGISRNGFSFNEFIQLGCNNEGFVTLYLKVTDAVGNTNTCWAEVLIEDALPPVITCPADKTLDCDDDLDNPFGEAEAIDNCNAQVTFVDAGELDQCKAGTLTRTWTATDGSDKSADVSCTQRITVLHVSDFTVQFPADATISTCPDDLGATGSPQTSDVDCELLGITHDDVVLTIAENACYTIERTWTVINTCIYDQGNPANTDLGIPQPLPRTYQDDGDGYFTYVQIIEVIDNDAPTIDCPGDQNFCDLTDGCEGQADLTITATDGCSQEGSLTYSYSIDAFNDGTFDIVDNGNDASGVYPYGTHRIKWVVEDGCGNTSTCEYLFTVEDCKNPTPVCLNGISIENMQTGCVDIWASDLLEYAFDNCSDASFVEGSVKMRREGALTSPQTSMTLCCEDVGTVIVEIWVEDEAGNADYCTTYIIVQDNLNNCDDSGEPTDDSRTVAGAVRNEIGQDVQDVTVTIDGMDDYVTGSNGGFHFDAPTNADYTITPSKDMNPLNGVSTFDLVLISQHVLGQQILDSPYQMIAADVNNDGNISTFDVVQLRQLILYIVTDFVDNSSWRFVDADYTFPNAQNPWMETFPEVIEINNLTQETLNNDFVAVKIGDVDGNAAANNVLGTDDRNKVGTLNFLIENKTINAGQTTTIDFRASDFTNINGYQFTLNFDVAALELTDIEAGAINATEANFGMTFLNEGMLTASWNKTATTIANDEVLFSLSFTAKATTELKNTLTISSRYTQAEAYQGTDLMDVALVFESNGETVATDFGLHQNTPNPFKGETIIGFDLPTASTATLKVYDVAGKVLKVIDGDFAKGYNQINLNGSDLQASGVLYYQLDTPTHSATMKMIVLE